MKKPRIPHIEISYPLVSDESWTLNRKRLSDIISARTKINTALQTAIQDPAISKSTFKLSKSDSTKLINVYNAVVADGRFIREFLSDPGGVAKKLRMSLPPSAVDAVHKASKAKGISALPITPAPESKIVIGIVVIVLVVILSNVDEGRFCGSIKVSKGPHKFTKKLCFDRSKLLKL